MTFLIVLLLGMAIGAGLLMAALARWADTDAGRRRLALHQAERRIRDAQTAAFSHMADVAEAAVYEATGQAPRGWPSDDAVGGDVELSSDRPRP